MNIFIILYTKGVDLPKKVRSFIIFFFDKMVLIIWKLVKNCVVVNVELYSEKLGCMLG